jgi:hypothetical protein
MASISFAARYRLAAGRFPERRFATARAAEHRLPAVLRGNLDRLVQVHLPFSETSTRLSVLNTEFWRR